MNTASLFRLLTSALALWSCDPGETTLVTSRHDGHTLELIDHPTMPGIGMTNHQPVLKFDGKMVSDENVGFPLLPEQYPGWIVRSYLADTLPSDRTPWTVYVSPGMFSREDFDRLAACFEAQRMQFQAGLDAFPRSATGKLSPGRIARLVYGEPPRPVIFRPKQGRFAVGDNTEIKENFILRPDGHWLLNIESNAGDGLHSTVFAAKGKLKAEQGKLVLEEPFVIDHPGIKAKPEMAGLSDADYLRSFADSTGRPLLSVIRNPF
ncbi:hypothetical protein [Larkinella soli]|uniref:hypothetical protein n=1 Tax=Larkinella soli TaxID=1770527 RepID=UPI000FFC81BF|nr:hypothetical protein [Larkinella soli]